ncbi:MAG TPA: alpha/beta fold hydrolase [Gemmatimonadaceae bacterium]|nr:alpha/beta fold hydrolase [Gemmatimonadaceae bacterium]
MITLVENAAIAYDDVGSGMPVVFLHAFPLNRTMWDPQVSALVGECRCIAIDVRGLGESAPMPPYSVDRYADDVAGVLDALQIERAVVVGLSLGGYVAFALWRRHRDRVRGFVFADTRASGDTPDGIERRRRLIEIAETQGSIGVANMQIAGLVGKTTREKRPDIYDATHRMMAQAPVDGVIGGLEALMTRPDSTTTCATITVPTLIVVGEEDAITPPKEARRLQQSIPGSRLEVLRQAGHLSSLERPAAFTTVLSEYLARLIYN